MGVGGGGVCVCMRRGWCGRGGEGGGGNLVVILVRVCEPVFRNLPHSFSWPLKKRTIHILDHPKC